ncbi:flagellin N-terminal helical domain-containing protein [Oceanobacillus neutriphilus]|uniref:Flagellin n=1 Tax=Oceanobacillus neutriphilus TaxID=531815 RepID=A0ABQ2NMT3_9BACI|nr:flagellin [Oceanobacillus neutriphilus]GGP07364.1 flagellin [Oceanobacillus neutriphilus]
MRINNNVMAFTIYHHMNNHFAMAQKSMLRIATGQRINSATDDPAGLAISEKMRAQIRGLNMAIRNTQDGILLLQTAEGAVNETHAILQRMRELSVKAANGTYSDPDREILQDEINQLREELTRIGKDTEFNKQSLLDGSFTNKRIQVGANSGQYIEISIGDVRTAALGVDEIDISTQEGADEAIGILDEAIKRASSQRSSLGAIQNRLEHTINNLSNTVMNLTQAESRIRDADIAKEMMLYTKHSLLAQVAMAMLAQGNQQPQMILQLLQN